jgi:solute carrier family 25 protein 39/40
MVLYDALLNHVIPQFTAAPLFAGVVARATVSTLFSPLELLRTRLQSTPPRADAPRTFQDTVVGMKRMMRAKGIRSLWRGLPSTLWRDVPFSGIYWMGYERSKRLFRERGYEGPSVAFTGGALSGACAAIVTSPFDVLKTRRQAMTGYKAVCTFPLAWEVVRNEGYNALFAGLTPRLAKIMPACGIMIACYEVRVFPSICYLV